MREIEREEERKGEGRRVRGREREEEGKVKGKRVRGGRVEGGGACGKKKEDKTGFSLEGRSIDCGTWGEQAQSNK